MNMCPPTGLSSFLTFWTSFLSELITLPVCPVDQYGCYGWSCIPCYAHLYIHYIFIGADPNTCDDEGRSALYLMIDQGGANPVILKELLKAGASPNKATWSLQQTPLHVAARRGYQVSLTTSFVFWCQWWIQVGASEWIWICCRAFQEL